MKIDDFLKEEMKWTDRDLEYRPVIGYWKVAELLQKWGEKQLLIHSVSNHVVCDGCGDTGRGKTTLQEPDGIDCEKCSSK